MSSRRTLVPQATYVCLSDNELEAVRVAPPGTWGDLSLLLFPE